MAEYKMPYGWESNYISKPVPKKTYSEEEVTLLELKAYKQGYREGYRDGREDA